MMSMLLSGVYVVVCLLLLVVVLLQQGKGGDNYKQWYDPCPYCKRTNHPPERCHYKDGNKGKHGKEGYAGYGGGASNKGIPGGQQPPP